MTSKPSVLFVCVHNADRSQIAAGYLSHLGKGGIDVRSAGSEPADTRGRLDQVPSLDIVALGGARKLDDDFGTVDRRR